MISILEINPDSLDQFVICGNIELVKDVKDKDGKIHAVIQLTSGSQIHFQESAREIVTALFPEDMDSPVAKNNKPILNKNDLN